MSNIFIDDILKSAWATRQEGNYDSTKTLLEEASKLCEDDDYESLARIQHIYMQIESDHGRYERALEFSTACVSLYRKSGNKDKIAHATRHLADLKRHLGMNEEALRSYEVAIDIYASDPSTEPLDLANAFRGYALLLETLSDRDKAIEVWKDSYELYESINIEAGVDEARQNLQRLKQLK